MERSGFGKAFCDDLPCRPYARLSVGVFSVEHDSRCLNGVTIVDRYVTRGVYLAGNVNLLSPVAVRCGMIGTARTAR